MKSVGSCFELLKVWGDFIVEYMIYKLNFSFWRKIEKFLLLVLLNRVIVLEFLI